MWPKIYEPDGAYQTDHTRERASGPAGGIRIPPRDCECRRGKTKCWNSEDRSAYENWEKKNLFFLLFLNFFDFVFMVREERGRKLFRKIEGVKWKIWGVGWELGFWVFLTFGFRIKRLYFLLICSLVPPLLSEWGSRLVIFVFVVVFRILNSQFKPPANEKKTIII